jgi:pimeloyl-ACP methyl ester carboxylesterase
MTSKAHESKRHSTTTPAHLPKGFTEKRANVGGVTINYKIGGHGPVVVLLHGYAQTSHRSGRPPAPTVAARVQHPGRVRGRRRPLRVREARGRGHR